MCSPGLIPVVFLISAVLLIYQSVVFSTEDKEKHFVHLKKDKTHQADQ